MARKAWEALGKSRGSLTTRPILRINAHGRLRALQLAQAIGTSRSALRVDGGRSPPRRQRQAPRVPGACDRGQGTQRQTDSPLVPPPRWRVTIPRRDDERRRGPFDENSYRKRDLVERKIGRFKELHSPLSSKKRSSSCRRSWVHPRHQTVRCAQPHVATDEGVRC